MTDAHSFGYMLLRTASDNLLNIGFSDIEDTISSPPLQQIPIDTLPTISEQRNFSRRDKSPMCKYPQEINLREATDCMPFFSFI